MATQNGSQIERDPAERGREALCRSSMMEHLVRALDQGIDIGHYGRLVFVMVGRFFLDHDELVGLMARQPGMDDEQARGMVEQIVTRDYSPPRRERIAEWQTHQDFPILPDPDDPDCGNVYSDLRFPPHVYEGINEYYEEKAHARQAA